MLQSVADELVRSRAFEQEMRQFAEIVSGDRELQDTLTKAVDKGVSRERFRDLYVELAAMYKLHFTAEQMEIAMHEQKQGKDKILPSMVQKLITIL